MAARCGGVIAERLARLGAAILFVCGLRYFHCFSSKDRRRQQHIRIISRWYGSSRHLGHVKKYPSYSFLLSLIVALVIWRSRFLWSQQLLPLYIIASSAFLTFACLRIARYTWSNPYGSNIAGMYIARLPITHLHATFLNLVVGCSFDL